jgi:hypothetical protein
VENCADESKVKEKPVIAVAAMGETPILPKMLELGTVEIPVFARIAKWPASPSSTVSSAEVMTLQAAEAKRKKRQVEKENIIVNLDDSS